MARYRRQIAIERFHAFLTAFLATMPEERRQAITEAADAIIQNERMSASCIEQVMKLLSVFM